MMKDTENLLEWCGGEKWNRWNRERLLDETGSEFGKMKEIQKIEKWKGILKWNAAGSKIGLIRGNR